MKEVINIKITVATVVEVSDSSYRNQALDVVESVECWDVEHLYKVLDYFFFYYHNFYSCSDKCKCLALFFEDFLIEKGLIRIRDSIFIVVPFDELSKDTKDFLSSI